MIYELIIELSWKFYSKQVWFWWSIQVTIVHMSRQLSCRDMCKIVTWCDHYFSCKSKTYFHKIWMMSSKGVCEIFRHDNFQRHILANIIFKFWLDFLIVFHYGVLCRVTYQYCLIMAWCQIHTRPFYKSMVVKFSDAYVYHQAAVS